MGYILYHLGLFYLTGTYEILLLLFIINVLLFYYT